MLPAESPCQALRTSRSVTTLFVFLLLSSVSHAQSPVALASLSAVAADVDTGEVLVAKHADIVLPIASITKLMTAMVVLDSGLPLEEYLEIRDWDSATGKNAYSRIRITSKARRSDLLRIALMSSENRASYNLALHHTGGMQAFVAAMNAKARSLGMSNSVFADPTGLSTENRSTALDLARMVAAAHGYAEIRDYSTTRQYTVNFRSPRYRLGYGNTNPLTGSNRWNVAVSKTGYLTEAGRCLVMVEIGPERKVAMVMLNSFGTRSPIGDAGRLRRFLNNGDKGSVAGAARDYERRMVKTHGLDSGGGD